MFDSQFWQRWFHSAVFVFTIIETLAHLYTLIRQLVSQWQTPPPNPQRPKPSTPDDSEKK